MIEQILAPEPIAAFFKVVMIDLVLAGDNVIVIGLAASGLPKSKRNKAVLVGVAAATLLRILFAIVAINLLKLIGLVLVGGLLLLWVCWKMWREINGERAAHHDDAEDVDHSEAEGDNGTAASAKTLGQAAWQIVIADISMSLDNVLAVAGAAREHPMVLFFGLTLSVTLMGFAASMMARLLHRYRWIAYAGLAIIVYVALDMIVRGLFQVMPFA